MGRGDARLGKQIRRNRKLAGLTQDAVGRELGVSPKTVGKWERGVAFPSPVNIRALRRAGLLDPGSDGGAEGKAEGQDAVSLEPMEGAAARSGPEASGALSRGEVLRDDEERVLLALFRTLSAEQQEAFLKIVRLMRSVGAGTAEEEEAEPGC